MSLNKDYLNGTRISYGGTLGFRLTDLESPVRAAHLVRNISMAFISGVVVPYNFSWIR
jgi:hypothetical protein